MAILAHVENIMCHLSLIRQNILVVRVYIGELLILEYMTDTGGVLHLMFRARVGTFIFGMLKYLGGTTLAIHLK